MAENWSAVAVEVAAAIADVGFTVVHRRIAPGVGPNSWTPGAPVTTNTNVKVISDTYSQFETDGNLVKADDKKLLMGADLVVPKTGDFFVIDSVIYRVLKVKPTEPGGTALIYEVQTRE